MFKFFKNRTLKKMIDNALSDNILEEEELNKIQAYAEEHNLDTGLIDNARKKHIQGLIQSKLDSIVKAQRYSYKDEEELNKIFEKLNITANFPVEFNKYRALWQIEEEGDINLNPIDDLPIGLKDNEDVYFKCQANWFQPNTRKAMKGYIGGSIGFKVAKGITLRVGKVIPQYDIIEEMKSLSLGDLYISNKRIQFVGQKKSTNITYGRVIDFRLFSNGIEIHKSSGKPDFFELGDTSDGDMIFYCLNKLMEN
jgi:hypothetical protein